MSDSTTAPSPANPEAPAETVLAMILRRITDDETASDYLFPEQCTPPMEEPPEGITPLGQLTDNERRLHAIHWLVHQEGMALVEEHNQLQKLRQAKEASGNPDSLKHIDTRIEKIWLILMGKKPMREAINALLWAEIFTRLPAIADTPVKLCSDWGIYPREESDEPTFFFMMGPESPDDLRFQEPAGHA